MRFAPGQEAAPPPRHAFRSLWDGFDAPDRWADESIALDRFSPFPPRRALVRGNSLGADPDGTTIRPRNAQPPRPLRAERDREDISHPPPAGMHQRPRDAFCAVGHRVGCETDPGAPSAVRRESERERLKPCRVAGGFRAGVVQRIEKFAVSALRRRAMSHRTECVSRCASPSRPRRRPARRAAPPRGPGRAFRAEPPRARRGDRRRRSRSPRALPPRRDATRSPHARRRRLVTPSARCHARWTGAPRAPAQARGNEHDPAIHRRRGERPGRLAPARRSPWR